MTAIKYEIKGNSNGTNQEVIIACCNSKGIAYKIMQCMKTDYHAIVVIEHKGKMQQIVFG